MTNLSKFTAHLKQTGLDGYLVPMADPFQNEMVPERYNRLKWLTGFTGSAGFLVVTQKQTILFVDGRYTAQAHQQVDTGQVVIKDYTYTNIKDFIRGAQGQKIGFDPWTLTHKEYGMLADGTAETLIPMPENLVDQVWENPPALSMHPIVEHPLKYAGVDSCTKRQRITETLQARDIDGVFLTRIDSIAWLLNIRGGDLDHTPVPLCAAYLDRQGHVTLFCNMDQAQGLDLKNAAYKDLSEIPSFINTIKNRTVLLDGQKASQAVYKAFESQNTVILGNDPCQLPKAISNKTEQDGARSCQIRDGAALTKFLYWVDQCALREQADEFKAMDKLLNLRRQQVLFQGPSFDTIAGINENGALAHYRTTDATNKKFEDGCLFLCDSGGQYLDGTTDTTRTVWVGAKAPPADIITNYTRVLKGHIALAQARFPKGTSGMQLDALARRPLWEAGLDYAHGTGHGVGCYLGVHDGPQGISKRYSSTMLEAGMLLSNEPAYYQEGRYGIRLENVIMVVPSASANGFYEFASLTCVPFDGKLIDFGMLDDLEKEWLRHYHRWVQKTLAPLLTKDEQTWLEGKLKEFL